MVSIVVEVMAVVEFYGLIPVIAAAERGKTVVAGGLRRKFHIRPSARRRDIESGSKLLVGGVIVVVGGEEVHRRVVIGTEVTDSRRSHI